MMTMRQRAEMFGGPPLSPNGRDRHWSLPSNSLAPSLYGVEPDSRRRSAIAANKPQRTESPYIQPCLDWLNSSHGRASAVELLQQQRLNIDAREVVNDVATKIWIHLSRQPETVINNIRGYCYLALRNHIADLMEGAKHVDIDLGTIAGEDDPLTLILDGSALGTQDTDGDIDLHDELRAYVESSGKKPVVVSAALSYLIVTRFDDIDCRDLKAPRAGARPDQALWWPCLWLAEHDETMFPRAEHGFDVLTEATPSRGVAAQRKRLQHAKDRAHHLLVMGTHHVGGAP